MYEYTYMLKKHRIFKADGSFFPHCNVSMPFQSLFLLVRFTHMSPKPLSLLANSVGVKQVSDHLIQLEIYSSMGQEGKHPRVMKDLASFIVRWLSLFLITERRQMLQPPSRKTRGRIQATADNLEMLGSKSS